MERSHDRVRNMVSGLIVDHTNTFNQLPRKRPLNEKLRLFPLFHERVSPIRGLDSVPVEDAQLANFTEKRRIPRPRVSIAERPAPSALVRPFDGSVEISLQVNDRSLSTAIRQFRMISLI